MENRSKIIGLSATIITMLLGIMVMSGWYLHNNFLTEIVPGQARMKFNVALGFVFSSIVLLFYYFPVKNKIRYPVSVVLAIIIFLIGALTLWEYIFGYNLGIDEFFADDKFPLTADYYPGRMSPISAVNFVLIGTGLFLLNKEKTATYQFCYLAVIAFFALLLLVGYNLVSNIPAFIRLAIHVAFGFVTLPIGIYFAQPILQQKVTFNYRLIAGFIAIVIFLSIFAALSNYYSEERTATFSLIESTDRMLSEAEQTYSLINDFESDCRGYIITGDSIFLRSFDPAGDVISSHLKKLKESAKNNVLLESTVDSLSVLVNKQINFLKQTVHLKSEKRFGSARKMERTGKGLYYMDQIRSLITKFRTEENNLLTEKKRANDKSVDAFNRASITFLISVFILIMVIYLTLRANFIKQKKAEDKRTILINELEKANSEIKKTNEALTTSNKELERSNEELGSFTYVVSHDLQEPLRKIRMLLSLILKRENENLAEDTKGNFTRVTSSAERMSMLIDGLLNYSRANTSAIAKEETDLNDLVKEVKHSLHHIIEEKHAVIKLSPLPKIKVVRLQFVQLFSNILENAMKYCKKNKAPQVQISAQIVKGEEISRLAADTRINYWKLSIADNGIGFEQEYENKVFDIFQRLHGRTEYNGTGIGLAICKKVIQNHNGFITATGKPGVGATFNIFIPVNE